MPPSAADRNLLFGILAVQLDFVSRDDLDRRHERLGCSTRPSRSATSCATRGPCRPRRRSLLDALVDEHLRAARRDAARSLAAVVARPPLQHAPRASPTADGKLDAVARRSPGRHHPAAGAPGPVPGYRILRPHARGGLGEVFVAEDAELNREVALKEIQGAHADDPASRGRFLLEAEITGGLEHPGIVPVYGLGTYADGRPFYAMRFIRGDSLKEAIERFHKADPPAGTRASRALALRQLLRRFVDVCNAVAYAHSRGVLHRDLKPGNIMLGKYGETLVVDWGLAKAGRARPRPTRRRRRKRPVRPRVRRRVRRRPYAGRPSARRRT